MKACALVLVLLAVLCVSRVSAEDYSMWKKIEYMRYAAHNKNVALYFRDMQKALGDIKDDPLILDNAKSKLEAETAVPPMFVSPEAQSSSGIVEPEIIPPAPASQSVDNPENVTTTPVPVPATTPGSTTPANPPLGEQPAPSQAPTPSTEIPPVPAATPTPSPFPQGLQYRLHGNDYLQYYYMTVLLSPSLTEQSLIVDTGSDLTALPCNCPGDGCSQLHHHPIYTTTNLTRVNCDEKIGEFTCQKCDKATAYCDFEMAYGEGSALSGALFREQVTLGNSTDRVDPQTQRPLNMVIGCTTSETGMFRSQLANGIMGLHAQSNSSYSLPNIVDYALQEGQTLERSFSLCIGSWGGYLTVGAFKTDKHLPAAKVQELKYGEKSNYRIQIYSIRVGKEKIYDYELAFDEKPYKMGLDSGTTFVFFRPNIYKKIMKAMNEYCKLGDGRCGGLPSFKAESCFAYATSYQHPTLEDFYNSFPVIKFRMGKDGAAGLAWKPINYLRREPGTFDKTAILYCNSFRIAEEGQPSLLGHIFMRGHDFNFNLDKKTIQFVEANCDSEEQSVPSRRVLQAIGSNGYYRGRRLPSTTPRN